MEFFSGHTYHIYNQGNNREQLFYEKENYAYFLKKVKKYITPHAHILAWCLMPNHYHFLIKLKEDYKNEEGKRVGGLNRAIGTLQSSYTQAMNKKHKRTGSLFRSRAKAKSLDINIQEHNNIVINCFLYIHQNPLRANLISNIKNWEYSSYLDYTGLRKDTFCNLELATDLLKLPQGELEFEAFSLKTIPDQFKIL